MKKLCDRLRELRGSESQVKISKVFDVSQQTWNTWENGKYEPNVTKLACICRHFRVSADWLLGISDAASVSAVPVASKTEPRPEAYWRDFVASQQATISKLTTLLAEGRPSTQPVVPALSGGRSVQKTA